MGKGYKKKVKNLCSRCQKNTTYGVVCGPCLARDRLVINNRSPFKK